MVKSIKCVVWDLDNTLWDGVLSEGDQVVPSSVVLETIKALDCRGILQSISSKNDYDTAMRKLKQFGIEHFFFIRKFIGIPSPRQYRLLSHD